MPWLLRFAAIFSSAIPRKLTGVQAGGNLYNAPVLFLNPGTRKKWAPPGLGGSLGTLRNTLGLFRTVRSELSHSASKKYFHNMGGN